MKSSERLCSEQRRKLYGCVGDKIWSDTVVIDFVDLECFNHQIMSPSSLRYARVGKLSFLNLSSYDRNVFCGSHQLNILKSSFTLWRHQTWLAYCRCGLPCDWSPINKKKSPSDNMII